MSVRRLIVNQVIQRNRILDITQTIVSKPNRNRLYDKKLIRKLTCCVFGHHNIQRPTICAEDLRALIRLESEPFGQIASGATERAEVLTSPARARRTRWPRTNSPHAQFTQVLFKPMSS